MRHRGTGRGRSAMKTAGVSGPFTFLFTEIAGSTRLWEEQLDAMRATLAQHDALLRQAVAAAGGQVFKTLGDGFCAVFVTAPAAVAAASAAQQAILRSI